MVESRMVWALKRATNTLNKLNSVNGLSSSSARAFSGPISSAIINPSTKLIPTVAPRFTYFASVTARNSIISHFRALHHHHKGVYVPSYRTMSTAAASVVENKEGLKLLVTAGSHAQKMVGMWLFASAAWVYSMVVLGGVTRLTRSGLSMTDWKFTGGLPPMSDDAWTIEFEKYKQSPEYKRVDPMDYYRQQNLIQSQIIVGEPQNYALDNLNQKIKEFQQWYQKGLEEQNKTAYEKRLLEKSHQQATQQGQQHLALEGKQTATLKSTGGISEKDKKSEFVT